MSEIAIIQGVAQRFARGSNMVPNILGTRYTFQQVGNSSKDPKK